MNGQRRVIRSTCFTKDTGNVWEFGFSPVPDAQFMANFDWRVLDANNDQIVHEFEAYIMRELPGANGPVLNMRFRDHSWREIPDDAELIAELHSPAA